jgi:predicted amidophosphoribosyltransferase
MMKKCERCPNGIEEDDSICEDCWEKQIRIDSQRNADCRREPSNAEWVEIWYKAHSGNEELHAFVSEMKEKYNITKK